MKKVPASLEIHPIFRGGTQEFGESKSRAGSNPPAPIHQLINSLVGDVNAICEILLGQVHRIEKFFQKHFSWMGGLAVSRNSDHLF